MYDVGSAAMKPAPFSSWTRRVQTPTKLEQILAECSEGTLTVENGKNCCLAAITGNGGCGAGLYGLSSGDNESAVVGRSEGLRGIGVYGRSVSEYGTGVFGQSQFGSGVRGESHVAGYGGYFVGADGAGAIAADTGVGTVVIQNIGGRPVLDVPTNGLISTGRIETEVLQILGGSDVAEQFEVREAAETVPLPGMVVCIDPEHEGDLVICSKANDQSVAGVISGAGGINTGMLIGQRGSIADGSVPIALSGRVYVLADASEVPILPGDLLATSATPGHVMKASEARDVRGVILGKAMTRLEGGRGLVLVLVNLH
jgi:hypothetical protein